MKRGIVSARHGSYDSDLNLSEGGKEQMRNLATAIKRAINGHNLTISLYCSTAPRAQQGIPIITEILDIPEDRVHSHEFLWDDDYHCGSSELSIQLAKGAIRDGSLAIFLSHLDIAPTVAYNTAKTLGVKYTRTDISYGEGILITNEGVRVLPD